MRDRTFDQLLVDATLHAVSYTHLTAKESSEEAERLAAIKQTLGTAQLEAIMAEAEELHRIQMEPDSPEALATLPLLELSDIAQTPAEPELSLIHI